MTGRRRVGTGWRRRRGRRRLRCRWAGRWRLRPRPRNEGPTWTTRHPTGSYISRAAPASHRRTNRGEQSLPQWKCPAGNRTRRYSGAAPYSWGWPCGSTIQSPKN